MKKHIKILPGFKNKSKPTITEYERFVMDFCQWLAYGLTLRANHILQN